MPLGLALLVDSEAGPAGRTSDSEVIAIRDQTHEQMHRANLLFTDRMASLGILSSGVAHEINNSLMTLVGASELGQMSLNSGDASEAQRNFEHIAESAQRISQCVTQLQVLAAAAMQNRFVLS